MTERAEMEAAIEAVLFVSSEPVPRERLAEIFDEGDREAAAEAVAAVIARYRGDGDDGGGGARGVFVEEVAGGVRLVTRPEMNPWLRRFFEVTGSQKLSMAAIETLAIIAYRQPMTAPEVQELRSVSSSGVFKTLLEKRLIRIAGRKEVVGRPFLYCTTREFLVHFGLKSLKDLPPLEELDEALDEAGGDLPGEAPPPEPGLESGPGVDREERILQSVAAIEEAEEDGGGGEREEAAEPAAEPASADDLQEAARSVGVGARAGGPGAAADDEVDDADDDEPIESDEVLADADPADEDLPDDALADDARPDAPTTDREGDPS
jgi:segregation and condensation protein B